MVKGDDVRIAGVKVGVVKDVEIVDRTRALVTFTSRRTRRSREATNAAIRYRNLVGQRYISLRQEVGETTRLHARERRSRCRGPRPALDLTVLFNGFKPLFQALSPSDLNKLSYEVVQVFQGEGGTLESLLQHTASVTSTLADRDEVICALIDNLNQVLDHLGDRDQQLSQLIGSFRQLVGGLKDDRQAILGSLDSISALSVETAGLVKGIRPPLVEDIKQLRVLRRQPRQEQGRARPGPPGAADQAREGRPHRDLRLVVQLLPLRVQGRGQAAAGPTAARRLQHGIGQVLAADDPLP